MLARAARESGALVIGIDADAASMVDASRRAARSPSKGGLPNALFVVAAAESPPPELDGAADDVTVQFPWGSLLTGILTADPSIAAGMARIAKPGAAVSVLVSVVERDGRTEGPLDQGRLGDAARAWEAFGFAAEEVRPATPGDLERSGSSWAKRLRAGRDRPAWVVRLRRRSRP